MPRGYRLFLVALGGLSLPIALGIGSYFGALYSSNQKQYHAVAGDQSGHNDYSGPSQSLPDISGLPSSVERVIANPHPTTSEDRESRDLAAQEASALWAFWMVVVSFASVLITAVGTLFLYKQIVLTREAVEDTGNATDAMREANDIAKTGSALELRPYVWFGKSEIRNVKVGESPTFVVEIKHAGQTPAYEVRSFVSFGLMPPGFNDTKFKFNRKPHYPISSVAQLFPGHEGLISNNIGSFTIDRQTFDRLAEQTQRFVCAGVVSYRDIFGKRHLTTFKCVSTLFVADGLMETAWVKKGGRSS